MKKVLSAITLLFISISVFGCLNNYDEYPQYELLYANTEETEYMLTIENTIYISDEDFIWYPEQEHDEIYGVCNYNGATLVYSTSSSICYCIKNAEDGFNPFCYVYSKEYEEELKTINFDMVDSVGFWKKDMSYDSVQHISDDEYVKSIISIVNNAENYIKLYDVGKTEADNRNNSIEESDEIYGEVERVGHIRFYSENLEGLFSSLLIIESNSELYYVIDYVVDEDLYICVEEMDTVSSVITQEKGTVLFSCLSSQQDIDNLIK